MIDYLHKGSIPFGIDQIMAIIENEFDSFKRRKIAQHLNIDIKQYFTQEYLSEILEDLLKGTTIDPNTQLTYKKPVNYPDKIQINYKADDVEAAISELETVIEEFSKIDSLIKNYESDQQGKIKLRIQTDYKNANGSFKERLKIMVENYLRMFANEKDDDYRYFITAVLLYHFEQCIIGNKTKTE
ncbi:MAG: hypothetical protein HY738_16905 [Bacteroidia bacterium]|nr:hypothetical protein [Bacteroidia bacterium]